jgi:hypothetical protein
MTTRTSWNSNLRPPKVAPLPVKCFRCNKDFEIKWVPPQKRWSQKNSWAYWTGETEGDLKICDNCLIHFYKHEKALFFEKVKVQKKRFLLRNYIGYGNIAPS